RLRGLVKVRRVSAFSMERSVRLFKRGGVPLFGLPPSWEGPRTLGAVGKRDHRSRASRVHTLSLIHRSVTDVGPRLEVEVTQRDDLIGGSGRLEEVACLLWLGRAATVEQALARYRADHDRRGPAALIDIRAASIQRSSPTITVDGEPVPFDV